MKALVLAALMLQPAGQRFDLVCEVTVSQAFRTEHYSVDLAEGRWCLQQGDGPCARDAVHPVRHSDGQSLVLWADETGRRTVSLDSGYLSGGQENHPYLAETGRCETRPFTGWDARGGG